MQVQELMTTNVATCRADDACSAAVRLMWDCDCGAVPVLDEDGRLAGMITDRDICMAAWSRDTSPSAIPLSLVMSRELTVCSPTDDLAAAERSMRANQIRRLPVVDGDRRLLGILSLADIVREASRRGRAKRVGADEIFSTLAEICQPRVAIAAPPIT